MPGARGLFFAEDDLPIGLQVYSLGDDIGQDFDAAFAAIAEIGYREIELPNLAGQPPAQIRAAADRAGLSITSVHVPLVAMMGGLTFGSPASEVAETLHQLGARWAVAPLCLIPATFRPQPGMDFAAALSSAVLAAGGDIWRQSAAVLNEKAAALSPFDIGVAFHNHSLEFAPFGITNGWEILWQETDPSLVTFEVDVGWITNAGVDPVAFLETYGHRASLLHLRDVAADSPRGFPIAMHSTEVGSGVVPFDRVLAAARQAGVRHYLVEQDGPFTLPRIDAVRQSHDYLANLVV